MFARQSVPPAVDVVECGGVEVAGSRVCVGMRGLWKAYPVLSRDAMGENSIRGGDWVK